MTASATAPSARDLRQRLRRGRRRHHAQSLSDVLSDAYLIALIVALYGWSLASGLRESLGSPAVLAADPGARYWLFVAAVLAVAGMVWLGLRAVGPLFSSAGAMWLVGSPIDRRAWLLPRLSALVAAAAIGAGVIGLGAAFAAGASTVDQFLWTAIGAAAIGCGGVALSVVAQAAPRSARWPRVLTIGPSLGAAALAAVVVAVDLTGAATLRIPVARVGVVVGLLALPLAAVTIVHAVRGLARIDRAALTAGAEIANATTAAALLLDPSMVTRMLETRRWRSVAVVRSWRPRRGPRWLVLVQRDLRRPLRQPTMLVAWLALLLVMAAVAVALPPAKGVAHLVLTYLAAIRFTAGLRAVARSPGLRRMLGGRDVTLHLSHAVLPALAGLVWYAAALPLVRSGVHGIDPLLALGVLLATYRTATRPPMRYGGPAIDTPFGLIPVDLVGQVLRGPDLLATVIVVQTLVF